MNINIELTPAEVLIISVALSATPEGPPQVEAVISSIAQKFVDAMDLALIPTTENP